MLKSCKWANVIWSPTTTMGTCDSHSLGEFFFSTFSRKVSVRVNLLPPTYPYIPTYITVNYSNVCWLKLCQTLSKHLTGTANDSHILLFMCLAHFATNLKFNSESRWVFAIPLQLTENARPGWMVKSKCAFERINQRDPQKWPTKTSHFHNIERFFI